MSDVVRRVGLALASLALPAAPALGQLRAELVASGFSQAVAFVQDPTDATVFLVVQQDGRVRVVRSGVVQPTDYLDLRGDVRNSGEQGLLGLAFSPDYATSGRVFVNFSNLSGHTVIARFTRSASNPLRAEPSSRFDLLWPGGQRFISQPFANHNGGNLAFGPDGFLYIGMGDGGSGNDPFHNAQNPQSLLGKMLRIDVRVSDTDPEGYNVPSSNPFAGRAGVLGEIWSLGLRNPWRWSFDNPSRGGTGALIVGDVGQGSWEEVNYEPPNRGGRNYGWRNREGAHNHITSLPPYSTPLLDPIHEYAHGGGASITGGFVYRGGNLGSNARGRYFFADFVKNRVWSMKLTVNNSSGEAVGTDLLEHTAELGAAASRLPASFGEDAAGELYVISYTGAIYRLAGSVPETPGGAKRRPLNQPPIGFAVPRPASAAAAPALAVQAPAPAAAVVQPCAAWAALLDALRQLLGDEPDRIVLTVGSPDPADDRARNAPSLLQCALWAARLDD